MQLDIYRRAEPEHKCSYLVVKAGRPIPEEATSVEWVAHARSVEMDEDAPSFSELGIDAPGQQLREKEYAITSVTHQPEATD